MRVATTRVCRRLRNRNSSLIKPKTKMLLRIKEFEKQSALYKPSFKKIGLVLVFYNRQRKVFSLAA